MAKKRRIPGATFGLFLLGSLAVPHAQTSCTPILRGVPALSGPPVWWDGNSNGTFPELPLENDKLDDPRWKGAASITYGSGATEELVFHAGQSNAIGGPALYFSWNVKVAPSTTSSDNILYVGISGIGQDVILKLTLASESSNAEGAFSAELFLKTVTGWELQQNNPSWLHGFTRVWINHPQNSWAFQIRIPISTAGLGNGLNLGSTFKMWYEVLTSTPTAAAVTYTWPRQPEGPTVANSTVFPFSEILPDNPTAWGLFQMGGGCTEGVSLDVSDVGTLNTPSSKINLNSPNHFFARPLNQTGGTIPPAGITARFRIANWGSQPDWNDLGPANMDKLWSEIRGGGAVSNTVPIFNGTRGELQFSWSLDPCEICRFNPVSDACYSNLSNCTFDYQRRSHQCMLVELSGTNLNFINNSVYRNMDFEHASTFEREASINIAGLKPITGAAAGPKRDVYLYVEKRNMPAVVEPVNPPSAPGSGKDAKGNAGKSVAGAVNPKGDSDNTVNRDGGYVGHDTLGVARPRPVFDSLAESRPTYIVHVYHATGDSMVINHKKVALLVPQSTFGYFIDHQGSLYGWEDTLMGVEKIAPNFYRLSIKNDSAASITTRITALERKPPQPGEVRGNFLTCLMRGDWQCWIWVLLIFLAVLFIIAVIRRKP